MNINLTPNECDFILSPPAIRQKAEEIFKDCLNGNTLFHFHSDKWASTVQTVLDVIKENYPNYDIPFHSRWGHFRVGGINRLESFDQLLLLKDPLERGRIKLDLVIPSVLLDAGSGNKWNFFEKESGKTFNRSEGLGVASFHWFLEGGFSSDGKSLRTDSRALQKIKLENLKSAFQVTEENPLAGCEGRVHLLSHLGYALENTKLFKDGRPGNLIDTLMARYGKSVSAVSILKCVLEGLGPIWPGRISAQVSVEEINLGDVWNHEKYGLVPFHKLSQWLTYSLIEPIMEAGIEVTGVEKLTGLAEYRNGGLFIDSGVLSPKDPTVFNAEWSPDSTFIIEWRALTIALLDRMGDEVQKALRKTPAEFPLAKVLEGGTWWAGRKLASQQRAGGTPPIKIKSDGTVF